MVRLADVIAPVTGGANWLTSTMMVLRQALAPLREREKAVMLNVYRHKAKRADNDSERNNPE